MKAHHLILPVLILLGFLSFISAYAENFSFQIRYKRIMGLLPDAPIYFQENEVGRVTDIFYTRAGDYLVSVEINEMFKNTATSNSLFYISHPPHSSERAALLIVQRTPGGTPVADGSVIEGQGEYSHLDELIATFQEKSGLSRQEMKQRLKKMRQSFENASLKLNKRLEQLLYELDIQLQVYSEKIESLPDHEQIQRLKNSISELEREMRGAQDDVRTYLETVVIPDIKSRLDTLRKKFEQQKSSDEIIEINAMQEQMDTMITI